MQVQPVKFTGNGLIGSAGFTAAIKSPEPYNKTFQPTYMDASQGTDGQGNVTVAAQPQRLAGVAFKGFTAVTIYNGTDNTGDPVLVATAPGTVALSYEVNCQKGLYVEVTGSGSGTVWLV
jgi:hypothetical protein